MNDSLGVDICCKFVCNVTHSDDIINYICSLAFVAGTRGIPSCKVYQYISYSKLLVTRVLALEAKINT